MADQQQLDLLQQGVKNWNAWRTQRPDMHPDLGGADLSGADLTNAILSEADLSGANLIKTDLSGATLYGATLYGAILYGAILRETNLVKTNLVKTNLNMADLTRADLSSANVSGASLKGTNFSSANLSRVNLSSSYVGWTVFGDIDLRTVKGLETVDHHSPSTIGADTLLRSQGDIPETFLRKAGLNDAFITYTRSLVQNPIEYYTCFISYSSQDQEFVERLYADLQAKGVRCWYAPEDLKIGDEFRQRIDESIRVYDKLIVILSQYSVESSWVEYEVNKALKKEQAQGKPVLFPLKLDEIIMETPEAWAAAIRKKRHIGDFVRWKEHDAYQAAFERLLRDLQASSIPPIKVI
jgi:hypothetical protein